MTPLRITQRRMNMVENTDSLTKNIVKERWASLGFEYNDNYKAGIESTEPLEALNLTYTVENTYMNKGGYLIYYDLDNTDKDDLLGYIQHLNDSNYIDLQTRTIVIDYMLYNPYVDLFIIISMVSTFKANGALESKFNMQEIKR